MGIKGNTPPLKNKLKKITVWLSYNSEKNVKFYNLVCFTRHSGAWDSIVDLSHVRKHLRNDVVFGVNWI